MAKAVAASQIEELLREYDPAIEALLREARAALCSKFVRGFELAFSNYNALVFAISPTEKASQAFVSIAGYPKWVTLFFSHGASLLDADCLLVGEGKRVRSMRLESAAQLDSPSVEALIAQAAAPHESALLVAQPLVTVLKMAVAERRARRPVPNLPHGHKRAPQSRGA